MFIKKLFEGKKEEAVHAQFTRFGKGIYPMRAVLNVRKTAKDLKISSSFELANDFIEFLSSLVPELKVSGIILSKEEIPGLTGKKKAGSFQYDVNNSLDSKKIKEILEKCYFILMDAEANGIIYKVKKKLPKPGKSAAKVNDKFCSLNLDLKYLDKFHSEFLWDIQKQFKKVRLEHIYEINEIVPPAGEKDFAKLRLLAERKGKLIRKIILDGKESVKEKEFQV
ncbi:MAG: hypothetical protein ABH817_01575 [archaeon]